MVEVNNNKNEIKENKENQNNNIKNKIKSILNNKKKIIIIGTISGIIILSIVIGIICGKIEQKKHDSLPIKVDISMTSYWGSIEYILYELDLDFDLVTMGANCMTGVQKGEFKTKKYGVLHTEFRYCKSNYTQILRVYNDTSDQELRDPKPGELPKFDNYGTKLRQDDITNDV